MLIFLHVFMEFTPQRFKLGWYGEIYIWKTYHGSSWMKGNAKIWIEIPICHFISYINVDNGTSASSCKITRDREAWTKDQRYIFQVNCTFLASWFKKFGNCTKRREHEQERRRIQKWQLWHFIVMCLKRE